MSCDIDYKAFMESFKNCRACQFYDNGEGCFAYEGLCYNQERILAIGKIIKDFTVGGDCKFFVKKGYLPFELAKQR